ncbi:hypothetical protein AB2063_002945 [Clostridium botulinum]
MEGWKLDRANEIKKEIEELEIFIREAERTPKGKIIKKVDYYIFKSTAYGAVDETEFTLSEPLKFKILMVLEKHLEELKEFFKSL